MVQHIQQVKTVSSQGVDVDNGVATKTTRTVADDQTADTQPASFTAARVVWYIAGVIITLLGIRFVLALLGASQGSAFVNFIYGLSYPFAAPFFGVFGYHTQYGVSRIEVSTLVAMAIYALLAWGIVRLITIRHANAP
jgi:hypothetical protein